MIGIYKITNIQTNKAYIGQAINLNRRWTDHKARAYYQDSGEYNSPLHQSIRKYGLENFTFEILEECTTDIIDEREIYWIKELNTLSPNGYNILIGGQLSRVEPTYCPICGKVKTRDANICLDCYKKSQRPDKPDKLELARLVKQYGFEGVGRKYGVSGKSISKWCITYGLPSTKSELINWYNKEMGIIIPTIQPFKRPVEQINLITGEIIQEFESAAAAARFLNKSKGSHITEVCKGTLKQAYGYKWRYKEINL